MTATDLNTYGTGHLNRYTPDNVGIAYDRGGANHIGGMAYYSSPTCGYSTPGDSESYDDSGCTTSYNSSEVKYAVDAWAQAKFQNSELKIVDGYSARLITLDQLEKFGYEYEQDDNCYYANANVPSWVYGDNYYYWAMSSADYVAVWSVDGSGDISGDTEIYRHRGAVRPVINVYKSKIPS